MRTALSLQASCNTLALAHGRELSGLQGGRVEGGAVAVGARGSRSGPVEDRGAGGASRAGRLVRHHQPARRAQHPAVANRNDNIVSVSAYTLSGGYDVQFRSGRERRRPASPPEHCSQRHPGSSPPAPSPSWSSYTSALRRRPCTGHRGPAPALRTSAGRRSCYDRAWQVQEILTQRGQHRNAGPAALVVAATAELQGLTSCTTTGTLSASPPSPAKHSSGTTLTSASEPEPSRRRVHAQRRPSWTSPLAKPSAEPTRAASLSPPSAKPCPQRARKSGQPRSTAVRSGPRNGVGATNPRRSAAMCPRKRRRFPS